MRAYSLNCGISLDGARSHMTLMYLGEQLDEVMDTLDLGTLYRDLGSHVPWPLFVRTYHRDLFGENKDVPVLLLDTDNEWLNLAREISEAFFSDKKIKPKTNFTEFRPHISTEKGFTDSWIYIYFPQLVSWEK